jgi:nucleotide-binding universal stress UspA family protein
MPSVVAPPLNESQSIMNDLSIVAKGRLDQFTAQCASRGIPSSVEVKTGVPGEVISRAAIAHDIVVVSRTGYSRMAGGQDALDSFVAEVIRDSVRPVLVAGSEFREESGIRNVLVAYDGSDHAARSLLVAAELAARPGVSCTLATVVQSEDQGQEILEPAEAFLYHHGVIPQKQIIINSKPADVICGLAASGGVDILIMGAYGHSSLREAIFGSTTERILAHCGVNVILQS